MEVELQHSSHEHPLILHKEVKDVGEVIVCKVCWQKISGGSAYSCKNCFFLLHKLCAELPIEMKHPLHSEHSLRLRQSPDDRAYCYVCKEDIAEKHFTYNCSHCDLDVDIGCAVRAQHFSHKHPLILIEEEKNDDGEAIVCMVCLQKIADSAYRCTTCSSYLHKLCAELPAEMELPMHSEHPLTLRPSWFILLSDVCHEVVDGFTYRCSPCNFNVDFICAMNAQHVSHEHPLILIEVKNDDAERASCAACLELITGSIYRCTKCSFHLHKFCSKLLAEIKHPMHPEHMLTLVTYTTFKCNACHIKFSKAFAYHCSLCNFNLDVCCAVRARSVKHGSHEHPLSPVLSPASFECHACRTKCEGFSYMCNTCSFWIHEECASLPTTFKHYSHVHHLALIYSIHEDFDSIWSCCRICGKQLPSESFWFYACKGCQYCIHVNCSTKTRSRDTIIAINDENLHGANLIRLPMPDESVNLIDGFFKKINLGNNKRKAKVNHFSHKHPLILFDAQADNNLCSANELLILNEQQNEKICNVCMQQISAPFYSCSLCDFFLHTWCAELPNLLQLPWYSDEFTLLEKPTKPRGLSKCLGCKNCCNGFTYSCVKVFDISYEVNCCLKCASLPNAIIHEIHEHPHLLKNNCIIEGCAACDQRIWILSFGCYICNFSLHYTCALLPRTIKHRYDKHPFTLIDAPIEDGPDEYICEFCEKEIDPTWWFYHCIDCDKSACAKCIY